MTFFLCMPLTPPSPPLLPYTTLFRSPHAPGLRERLARQAVAVRDAGSFRFPAGVRRSEGTRLNSSHTVTSYAVFCLKKKIQVCPSTVARLRCYLRTLCSMWIGLFFYP